MSRIDVLQGQEMAKASAERQASQLQAVDRALARINIGDYGRCLECDKFVAIGRLDIDPTVEHCIKCAVALE